jgi:hypothetical protein
MFKENHSHRTPGLFGIQNTLPEAKREKLYKSWAHPFYELIFSRIDESLFSTLFNEDNGRPNAPINCLVSGIILQQRFGWSCEELFTHMDFDMLTRWALGLDDLEQTPFCAATFFNFRNRLQQHYQNTGENLIETVFDSLTAKQLKELKIRTEIQRMDSFQAVSNIISYNRVQLLIEVLIRLHNSMNQEDRLMYGKLFREYTKQKSGNFMYRLKKEEIPNTLEQLGEVYHALYCALKEREETQAFMVFERVYHEHFTLFSGLIGVKSSSDIGSNSLQSPDDLDATFARKNGRSYRGQVVNVTETANPDNELQLITDVAVEANNISDASILESQLDQIREKTPDLNEMHTDGNYASDENAKKCEKAGINHVLSGTKGIKASVPLTIDMDENGYTVHCPCQTVRAEKTPTQYKAVFDQNICRTCPHTAQCTQTLRPSGKRVFYFKHQHFLVSHRKQAISKLPPERQTLRANVEATVKEFTKMFNHKKKMRIRGRFMTMTCACAKAIDVNFGRIMRYRQNANHEDTCVSCFSGLITVFQTFAQHATAA